MASIPAPFAQGSLKPPLTAAQYTTIVTYLVAALNAEGNTTDPTAVMKLLGPLGQNDQAVIAFYEQVAFAGGTDTTGGKTDTTFDPSVPGFDTLAGFFQAISSKNTWIRVGEFAAGFLLLGIGLYVVLKPSSAPTAPNVGRGSLISKTVKKASPLPERQASYSNQYSRPANVDLNAPIL